MTIISQNLIRFQRQKELNNKRLAEKSGVSVRTIERIRSGQHVPDLNTMTLLAKALDKAPEELVKGAIEKCAHNKFQPLKNPAKFPKFITLGQALANLSEQERAELIEDMRKAAIELERKDFTRFEREIGKGKREDRLARFFAKSLAALTLILIIVISLRILLQLLPNPWL